MPNTSLKDCLSQTHQGNNSAITILLFGSSGFIGKQVAKGLRRMGYTLRQPTHHEADFIQPNWAQMTKLCAGVDVIINMVGVMSQDEALLEQVHHDTPVAIASLARQQGVKHWINLSALGADDTHEVAFVGSKGRGDAALLDLIDSNFSVSLARPSLVYGRGGASCQMFLKLATSPVLVLPNAGKQLIQPVHVMDVAQGLIHLVTRYNELSVDHSLPSRSLPVCSLPNIINFTGAEPCTVADYLTMMRVAIHHKRAPTIAAISPLLASAGSMCLRPFMPASVKQIVSKDSLTLLEEGAIADNTSFIQLLGRLPLGYREFSQYS